jgi:hypothetical protein
MGDLPKEKGKSDLIVMDDLPKWKMERIWSTFYLCFNFFYLCNSLSIYRENNYVGKIPPQFTDGNIPTIFLFVFINFLIIKVCNFQNLKVSKERERG